MNSFVAIVLLLELMAIRTVTALLLLFATLTVATVKYPAGAVYNRVSVAAEGISTIPNLPVAIFKSPFLI
jgi:hypothetical protein